MFGIDISLPIGALAICAAAIIVAAIAFHKRIKAFTAAHARLRIAMAILCVPLAFFLMEYPYNNRLFTMEVQFLALGLAITAALFVIVYFIAQRTRGSMIAFLAVCMVWGIANHFVAEFKGQPILPSDMFALTTAAEVSGGYTYTIDDRLLVTLVVFALASTCILLMPKSKLTRKKVLANSGIGLAMLLAFGLWFAYSDIEDDYGCTVDVWSSLKSYKLHGSLACFLQRAQLLFPEAPDGYSSEEAEALLEGEGEVSAEEIEEAAEATAEDVQPTIIAIMGETYSDLSNFSFVSDVYEGLTYFDSIDDALVKGEVYVSALGGGTCNSEFEFLTGLSEGYLGAGTYPYVLYDFDGVNNLASYLSSLGYTTTAIHPAEGSNWRRDRVYAQLGFDNFYDIESFDDAETFRNKTTDAATYEKVLEVLEESDGPQFIFDVTYMSHSGYQSGLVPDDEMLTFEIDGVEYPEFNEYITVVSRADQEFYEFLEELEQLDEPIVVVYFGDHQPSLSDWLAEESFGTSVDDMTIDQTQQRYVTPYLIWTNSDELKEAWATSGLASDDYDPDAGDDDEADESDDQADAEDAEDADADAEDAAEADEDEEDADEEAEADESDTTNITSLNYLGAMTLKAAGLPLNDYFAYVLAASDDMPAINLNGYMDADGTWYWHGQESGSTLLYNQLAIVQYMMLFDHD